MARKSGIRVSPKLISLVGRKLYTRNLVEIAVRETQQNSKDACLKAGVDPKILISIEYKSDLDTTTVWIKDNGCGMDEEILADYFLFYGESTKGGSAIETGRFGVGVGAVLCADWWEVKTLDSYTNSELASEDRYIQKLDEPIQGTEITATYNGISRYEWWPEVLDYICLSDVDINFVLIDDGDIRFSCEHCGLVGEKVLLSDNPLWKGYAVQNFEQGNFRISNRVVVRLNGLVQHRRYVYGSHLESNILIDLESFYEPTDPKFPMVMSREKLTGEVELEVQRWIAQLVENPATTEVKIKRTLEPPGVKFVPGKILRGKRTMYGNSDEKYLQVYEKQGGTVLEELRDWIRRAGSSYNAEETDLKPYIDENANFPIMRLLDYEPSPDDIERDSQFILTWSRILELVMMDGYQFGIGLTSESIYSETNEVDGILFFTLNPRAFPEDSKKATVINLWIKACHEAAHLISTDLHGESHEATVEYIQMSTSNSILDSLTHLMKLL